MVGLIRGYFFPLKEKAGGGTDEGVLFPHEGKSTPSSAGGGTLASEQIASLTRGAGTVSGF